MYPPARSACLNSLEYVTSCMLERVLFDLSRFLRSTAIEIILPLNSFLMYCGHVDLISYIYHKKVKVKTKKGESRYKSSPQ